MSMITKCPSCGTAFRVTPQQLQAQHGMVRCGRCATVFDGFKSLAMQRDDSPGETPPAATGSHIEPRIVDIPALPPANVVQSTAVSVGNATRMPADPVPAGSRLTAEAAIRGPLPPAIPPPAAPVAEIASFARLEEPVAPDVIAETAIGESPPVVHELVTAAIAPSPVVLPAQPAAAQHENVPNAAVPEPPPTDAEPAIAPGSPDTMPMAEEPTSAQSQAAPAATLPETLPAAAVDALTAPPDVRFESVPLPRRSSGGLAFGIFILLLGLLAQGVYFYRGEVAAYVPEARPYLNRICEQLRCTVALPQRPRSISIEASDLQAIDPANPGLIVLTATLRNQAATVLGYPALDVVLTNAKEHTVARRIFLPAEYLAAGKDVRTGFAPNAEMTVKLTIDSGDLGAAGFRLDLLAAPAQ